MNPSRDSMNLSNYTPYVWYEDRLVQSLRIDRREWVGNTAFGSAKGMEWPKSRYNPESLVGIRTRPSPIKQNSDNYARLLDRCCVCLDGCPVLCESSDG
jgi:hypothetical protein